MVKVSTCRVLVWITSAGETICRFRGSGNVIVDCGGKWHVLGKFELAGSVR
jgi:hypothetical protein